MKKELYFDCVNKWRKEQNVTRLIYRITVYNQSLTAYETHRLASKITNINSCKFVNACLDDIEYLKDNNFIIEEYENFGGWSYNKKTKRCKNCLPKKILKKGNRK